MTWLVLTQFLKGNVCVCVCVSCSGMFYLAISWTSPPGSLSVEFSRQEYQSGLPFPSPGDLPDLGTEPGSPAF